MNGQEFTSDKIGAIGAAIVDILAEGNSVAIPGFGTFFPRKPMNMSKPTPRDAGF